MDLDIVLLKMRGSAHKFRLAAPLIPLILLNYTLLITKNVYST